MIFRTMGVLLLEFGWVLLLVSFVTRVEDEDDCGGVCGCHKGPCTHTSLT